MGRLLLAGALVLLALGPAHAGPTRKVLIESEPPGASVYVDDVDKGVACEPTPCEINAPVGTVMLIIRLDKYEPEIKEIDVPKGKRALQQKYKLKSAIATIKVDVPKGASVRIDEEDKGKAPVEISVAAGDPHHIVVVSNGKTVFDDIQELSTGEEYVVKPKIASAPTVAETPTVTDDDDESSGGSDDDGSVGSGRITGKTDGKPRSAFISGGLAFDVGIRHVSYTTPAMSDFVRELEGGSQALAGPAVEFWPGRMLGVYPLRGLSLFARAQFSVVAQTVTGKDLDGAVTSKWSSYEASLRQRFQLSTFVVEVSGGYVQDSFGFDASSMNDLDKMPIADYQSLRLGARLGFVSDNIEPYLSAENRIVFAAGELASRYASSSATGLRGSAGVMMKLGMLNARLEGTLMSYSWDLTYENTSKWKASAASDSLMLVSAVVGVSY
jgi:hypothetical protein